MRPLRLAVPLVLVAAVAACGDDSTEPLDTPASTTTPPADETLPTVPPAGGGYEWATGPDDVVIDVSFEGGFVPAGAVFASTPVGMVTGDGRFLSTGPTTLQFPGALLPNLQQQSITPAGIEELLASADELGLLTAGVEYPRNDQIADAPDTVVTITVNGETYEHSAYALGFDTETDPARKALADFVIMMEDPAGTLGDEVGPAEAYLAEAYLIQATPIEPTTTSTDIAPTIVPWPADAPVSLASAAECAEVPASFGDPLFTDATQLTYFTEGDVTYQLAVVQRYPGRSC